MNSIWDAEELAKNWSLSFDELKLLKNKPEKAHLGFVAQRKHYQCFGEFLHSQSDIASSHLKYLTDQLDLPISGFDSYNFNSRIGRRHRKEII